MESRLFIKTATQLITRIKDTALVAAISGANSSESEAIQKQITAAFTGLQNPTLSSAARLRDTAIEHGYEVDGRVLHRLTHAENCWSN